MMDIYFHHLAAKLDKERRDWRENTVIILDNASYHSSQTTLNTMEKLNLPILYTGPNSYDAVPAELFFAALKSTDINPRKVSLGKR